MVARFSRVYGAAAYRGEWPTPDRVIPARLFFALWHQIPAIDAGERLECAEAARLGQALAENGTDMKVRREAKRLARLAVPLIYPESDEA